MSAPDRKITPHCVFPVIQHVATTVAPANMSLENQTEAVLNATELAAAPGHADPDGEWTNRVASK